MVFQGLGVSVHRAKQRMSEPRKPSTRNRGEPPKKRPSTPPPKAPPPKKRAASPAPKPPPPEPAEQGLPTKLRDGQPLPTLPEQQGDEALLKGYQGIAERLDNSMIMAEPLNG